MPKKQADGRYRAKVTVAPGEKPIYISARTLSELRQKRQYVLDHYRDGVRPRDITLRALVVEWFDVFKRPRIKSASTLKNYQNAINVHIIPFFHESQLLRAVRLADLQSCVDATAGMSSTVSGLVLSVLRHAYRYAVAEGMIPSDISSALERPIPSATKEKQAFTPDQEQRLLDTAANHPDGLMIYLLYYLGCRRGEMLGLQWGDFDWSTRMVHISRAVNFNVSGKSSVAVVTDTKTTAGDRYVPIPDALASVLLPLRSLPHLYLIHDKQGRPLNANRMRLRWNKLMSAAGYTHLSPNYIDRRDKALREGLPVKNPNLAYDYVAEITTHAFRHNYITACVVAGIPAEVTMRIVGHRDYATTINIYTHFQAEQTRKSSISLAGVLREAGCQKVAETSFPALSSSYQTVDTKGFTDLSLRK